MFSAIIDADAEANRKHIRDKRGAYLDKILTRTSLENSGL